MTAAERESLIAGYRERFIAAAQSAVLVYVTKMAEAGVGEDDIRRLVRDYMDTEITPWFRDGMRKIGAVVDFWRTPSPSDEVH